MAYINRQILVTPTQITSDQDDYAPTGWESADVIMLSADDSIPAITSFKAGKNGEQKILYNNGSTPLYIPGEHPDGTAANRVIAPQDLFLAPKSSISLIYDGTNSRWWASRNANTLDSQIKGYSYRYIPGTSTSGDIYDVTFILSGSGATRTTTAATSTVPCALDCQTGSTSSGVSILAFPKTITQIGYIGFCHMYMGGTISLPVLSDSSNTYTFEMALATANNSVTIQENNTLGVIYTHGTNSGKFQAYCKDGSSTTPADTGITVAANTLYNIWFAIDKARTEARFYINGAFVCRITGNIPAASTKTGRVGIFKSVGATNTRLYVHQAHCGLIFT